MAIPMHFRLAVSGPIANIRIRAKSTFERGMLRGQTIQPIAPDSLHKWGFVEKLSPQPQGGKRPGRIESQATWLCSSEGATHCERLSLLRGAGRSYNRMPKPVVHGAPVMTQYCGSCGERHAANARYCSACGNPTTQPKRPERKTRSPRWQRHRLQPDEQVLWGGSISARALFPLFLGALAASAGLWWGINAPAGTQVMGLIAIWSLYATYVFYRKLDESYVLTNRRIIHQHGILRRITNFVEVIDIDDVGIEQSIWQQLLAVGDIAVESTDRSHPLIIMRGIYPASEIATLIDETRHQERVARGVHVEMV